MCIFCCDILCWFSFITCCGCRDVVTRRLVFFPPDAYYDNIEPNEKFSDFYHRLSSRPETNESDDIKHEDEHRRRHRSSSGDVVLEVGHEANTSSKHKKHEIHSLHASLDQNEMERLNSTEDTLSAAAEATNTTKPSATKHTNEQRRSMRTQNGSIPLLDKNTFGTFRIKDDDANLARFYWKNYKIKMRNFTSQYLLTKRGTTIASYHIQHPSATYTVLFSHGNAADIGLMRNHLCRMYQKCSVSIFAYEYSGYGKSSGKATEKNTYADIERAYQFMTDTLGIKPCHIILYGQSLGTCVSIYLATQYPVGGVILHSPLMSGLRVMQHFDKTYWFDIYPVVEQIQQVFAPIFVIHGNRDKEIDVIHGKILSRLAPNAYPPWFVPYAGHNDIEVMFPDALFKRVLNFIKHLADLETAYLNNDDNTLQSVQDDEDDDEDDEEDDDIDDEEEEDTELAQYKHRSVGHLAKSVTRKQTDHSLSPPPPQSMMTASQDRERVRQITLPSRKFSNTGDDEESVLKTPSVAASLSIKDSNFISMSMKEEKSTNKGYDAVLTPTMRTIHSQEQSTSEMHPLPMANTMDESHTISTVNNLKSQAKKSRKSRKNVVNAHSDIDEEKSKTESRSYKKSRSRKQRRRRRKNKKDKRLRKNASHRLILPTSNHMTKNAKKSFERRDKLLIEANDSSSTGSSSSAEDIAVIENIAPPQANNDNNGEDHGDSSSEENNLECVAQKKNENKPGNVKQ